MSVESLLRKIFEPKAVKEQREIELQEAAFAKERQATHDYLRGNISPEEYQKINDELQPFTQIDFRKLAQNVRLRQ